MTLDDYPIDKDYCDVSGGERADCSITDGRGVEYNSDSLPKAEMDDAMNQYEHTGIEDSDVRTTFNAAESDDEHHYNRLFWYHSGLDRNTAGGETRDSSFKVDKNTVDDKRRAEAVCCQIGLPEREANQVCRFVASADGRPWNHLGGIDALIIGEIAYQVAETAEDALQNPLIASDTVQSLASSGINRGKIDLSKTIKWHFERRDD